MRVPYSWLREVVAAGAPGWDVSPDDLEQTFVRIGHEVEEVIPVGPVAGPLKIARVVEIEELTEFKKPIRAVTSENRRYVTSSAVQQISSLVISWWWRCRAPHCRATSRSPRARRTVAPPTG